MGGLRGCSGNLLHDTDRSVAAGSNRRRMTGDAGNAWAACSIFQLATRQSRVTATWPVSGSGCCCFLFIIAGRISWGCNVASPCDYCCASRRNCLTPPEYIYISCPVPPPAAAVEAGMREKGRGGLGIGVPSLICYLFIFRPSDVNEL